MTDYFAWRAEQEAVREANEATRRLSDRLLALTVQYGPTMTRTTPTTPTPTTPTTPPTTTTTPTTTPIGLWIAGGALVADAAVWLWGRR